MRIGMTLIGLIACCAVVVAEEASVVPGANRYYLDPDMDVAVWVQRFEGESREVFAERSEILAALDISPGMDVADVGAGTGLFVPLLAQAVGRTGQVYALDISPAFIKHLRARVSEAALENVHIVQNTPTALKLTAASLDLVFLCDVYHHVEYPQRFLGAIHEALRPGGRLVIVDFERIPGVSRGWILSHVRAGREVVVEEIEAAGFERTDKPSPVVLEENYLVEFRRP